MFMSYRGESHIKLEAGEAGNRRDKVGEAEREKILGEMNYGAFLRQSGNLLQWRLYGIYVSK